MKRIRIRRGDLKLDPPPAPDVMGEQFRARVQDALQQMSRRAPATPRPTQADHHYTCAGRTGNEPCPESQYVSGIYFQADADAWMERRGWRRRGGAWYCRDHVGQVDEHGQPRVPHVLHLYRCGYNDGECRAVNEVRLPSSVASLVADSTAQADGWLVLRDEDGQWIRCPRHSYDRP